jgi:hypothetical protein
MSRLEEAQAQPRKATVLPSTELEEPETRDICFRVVIEVEL